ncbi:hypothetical protein [Emcibacter nanhaiensis]|uniref:ABM domain-containing protein n=1 Tax=Emcibacter nanhaiensis TaxID=1505037 RepID=A0A501PBG9_9PROT|nr:hypothetical protein [Emcibacter nanhaiensis]TPD57700.1 hypothetical protein FIV46_16480 [Emcibacter nanhaiensis]
MKCVTLVRFTPKEKRPSVEYKKFLDGIMHVYAGAEGLRHKYFTVSDSGEAIGIYEWTSRALAEGFFNDDWDRMMQGMATRHALEYLTVRAELDNDAGGFEFYG